MSEKDFKKPRFRHELKFCIELGDMKRLTKDLLDFCEFDPHVGPTHSYEISSTYYDTRDLRFYLDREESVAYRRKIRLRSYVEDRKSKALFIEIKEKHKQFVNKKRINMKSQDILSMGINHDEIPLELVVQHMEDSAEAREIDYLGRRLGLVPVVMIRYLRTPLIPKTDRDMRITFDTRITAGGKFLHQYDEEIEKPIIDPSQAILEVKSNSSMPLWLQSALRRYELSQTRYSKYCLGVDAVFNKGKPFIPTEERSALDELKKRRIELQSVA